MDQNFVALQSPTGEGYVALGRTTKGKLFRKQILRMDSTFTHPGMPGHKIHVDEAFAKTMVANFKSGVCDIVQVPMVNDANQHVEGPDKNLGEVVDLSYDSKGVYAVIDARKHGDDFGKTLLGASALMSLDYKDTADDTKKGPTLLHVAVTNRPYITNLEDYEEIVAASADTSGDAPVVLIPASDPEEKMELEEMLAALKKDHDIDVESLQEQAKGAQSQDELVAAMSNVLTSATGKAGPASDAELTVSDVASAVIELAEERVALSGQVDALLATNETMAQKQAEEEIDGYIKAGRILPKQRDTMISLSRSDRTAFDSLLPDNPVVALSASGVDTFDAPEKSEEFQKNIDRLAAIANGTK